MNSLDILVAANRLQTFFGIPNIKASDKVDFTTKGFRAHPEINEVQCIRCTEMFIITKESIPMIRGHNCRGPFYSNFQRQPEPYSSSWTGNPNDLFYEEFRVATFLQWEYRDETTIQELAKSGFYLILNKNLVLCCYCNFSLAEASKGGANATRAHLIFHPECVTNKKEKDKAIKTSYQKKYPKIVTSNEIDDLCKLVDSKLFVKALEMGFSDKDIRLAAENRKTLGLSNFNNFDELIEALTTPALQPTVSSADSSQKPPALEEENRKLKDARLCKVCLDDEVGVVFLPCGHLATCVQCAPTVTLCPICRASINASVRTFLS